MTEPNPCCHSGLPASVGAEINDLSSVVKLFWAWEDHDSFMYTQNLYTGLYRGRIEVSLIKCFNKNEIFATKCVPIMRNGYRQTSRRFEDTNACRMMKEFLPSMIVNRYGYVLFSEDDMVLLKMLF